MDDRERDYFFSKVPGKTYVSSRFGTGAAMRYASQVMETEGGARFEQIGEEIVLRATPKGRHEIKAAFLEDDRSIRSLTIQRFHANRGPDEKDYFTFVHGEIERLIEFLIGIKTMRLDGEEKRHLTADDLRHLILNQAGARALFRDNEDLLVEAATNADLKRDLVALGYRRAQLARFERLLGDRAFFDAERERLKVGPEALWQSFFELNTWIFGYGLSFQFTTSLGDRALEQVVSGHSIGGPGKRVDALMKTQARINALCFVEIKRHDTPLLGASEYRPGCWSPSSELAGAVAQTQGTVQAAMDDLGRKLGPTSRTGDPTGEVIFNLDPRAFLVVGDLGQFDTPHGPNEGKFRSFELFRRNVRRPEILTFDELLHRARFIVEDDEHASGGAAGDRSA